MHIDFSCPQCARRYRVKQELAGKNAKCGQCGHKMPIPTATAPVLATATSIAGGSQKPAFQKAASPANDSDRLAAAEIGADLGTGGVNSWLDEELKVAPPPPPKPPGEKKCAACGHTLPPGAVLCVACGYDKRAKKKLETKHIDENASKGIGSKLRTGASLVRGTIFSFLGAMLGAIIWAAFAYFTHLELGYIAWGLGGLAGLGMAWGHEDSGGTVAGIIAAGMSLVGIVAAKILIIVFVLAALFHGVARERGKIEQEHRMAQNLAPIDHKRMQLEFVVTNEKLEASGHNMLEATEQQWDEARAKAKQELAAMTEAELDARLAVIDAEAPDALPLNPAAGPAIQPAPVKEGPNLIALFFTSMFSPIDGIFILLAVATAYKVGSGQATS